MYYCLMSLGRLKFCKEHKTLLEQNTVTGLSAAESFICLFFSSYSHALFCLQLRRLHQKPSASITSQFRKFLISQIPTGEMHVKNRRKTQSKQRI